MSLEGLLWIFEGLSGRVHYCYTLSEDRSTWILPPFYWLAGGLSFPDTLSSSRHLAMCFPGPLGAGGHELAPVVVLPPLWRPLSFLYSLLFSPSLTSLPPPLLFFSLSELPGGEASDLRCGR